MDELVKLITEKTGISEAQAQQAAEVAVGFFKDKLPAPLAGQIDAVLSGSAANAGDALKNLGGLFGKK